jgi:hypothetical protein
VLYAIAGFFVVAFPLGGALTLAVLLAILFIVEGALRVLFAMTASATVEQVAAHQLKSSEEVGKVSKADTVARESAGDLRSARAPNERIVAP